MTKMLWLWLIPSLINYLVPVFATTKERSAKHYDPEFYIRKPVWNLREALGWKTQGDRIRWCFWMFTPILCVVLAIILFSVFCGVVLIKLWDDHITPWMRKKL